MEATILVSKSHLSSGKIAALKIIGCVVVKMVAAGMFKRAVFGARMPARLTFWHSRRQCRGFMRYCRFVNLADHMDVNVAHYITATVRLPKISNFFFIFFFIYLFFICRYGIKTS
jgi:hypothetical protein